MSAFLGIGAGPIQTGIFVSGAAQGGFSRIVLADVDEALVAALRSAGSVTVNTAGSESVESSTFDGIEVYNPAVAEDRERLVQVAATADAVCTALPSTALFGHIAPWLTEAFQSDPDRRRYIFAAENSTTAAEELREKVGEFAETYYLDTVIGKMSKVFTTDESELLPLAPDLDRGHLVEAFNDIYTASAPGLEELGIEGLYPKQDLYPFEEAKLYGHNTTHFMLAFLLHERGCRYMHEAADQPDLVALTKSVLVEECGAALCRKHAGADPFFAPAAFREFAHGLVDRMVSPVLKDSIDRVIRDPERKLGWQDRMIGSIRLCLDQGVQPSQLLSATAAAARESFGQDAAAVAAGLANLWSAAPAGEVSALVDKIVHAEEGS